MILAYSVARAGQAPVVAGLSSQTVGELQCFYAPYESPAEPAHLQQDAVKFFGVNRQIFAHTDCITFRFPTLVRDEAELRDFVEKHAEQLRAELERLQGLAQVTAYYEPPPEATAETGMDYLRAKAQRARARDDWEHALRGATKDLTIDILAQGDRAHLLVKREDVHALLDTLSKRFHAAGPFPPSSFAKLVS